MSFRGCVLLIAKGCAGVVQPRQQAELEKLVELAELEKLPNLQHRLELAAIEELVVLP